MTSASNHEDHAGRASRAGSAMVASDRRRRRWRRCLGSRCSPLAAAVRTARVSPAPDRTKAQFVAYAHCMRSHGVSDFPDPTTPPGGGVAFSIHGGPGSDLNRNNPTFKAANQACRTLLPGGQQAPTQSSPKIAAEVRWARCLRSHGVPSFPDPNGQGAFDSSKFDPTSPAFQTASKACMSLQPTGSVSAVPGPG